MLTAARPTAARPARAAPSAPAGWPMQSCALWVRTPPPPASHVTSTSHLVALSSPMLLDSTFDLKFILTGEFAWRVGLLTAASTLPVWIGKVAAHYCTPRITAKLS